MRWGAERRSDEARACASPQGQVFLAAGGSNAPQWLQAFDGGPVQPPVAACGTWPPPSRRWTRVVRSAPSLFWMGRTVLVRKAAFRIEHQVDVGIDDVLVGRPRTDF